MFEYDDLGVDLDDGRPTVHQAEGDALIRVRRDFDMEIVAVERLEDMGFVELIEVAPPGTTDEELAGEFLPVLDDEDSDGFLIDFVGQRVPELRDAGWVVEIDDDFPYRVIEGEQHWYADVADGVDEWAWRSAASGTACCRSSWRCCAIRPSRSTSFDRKSPASSPYTRPTAGP
jgi:hypothetical protein